MLKIVCKTSYVSRSMQLNRLRIVKCRGLGLYDNLLLNLTHTSLSSCLSQLVPDRSEGATLNYFKGKNRDSLIIISS